MNRLALTAVILLVVLFVLSPVRAVAGTTGVISGYVVSNLGFPLGGATVELVGIRDSRLPNRDIDFRHEVIDSRTTDPNGFYVFLSLDPGLYALRPLANGWNFSCLPRVIVAADQTSFVDMAMTQPQMPIDCGPQLYYGPF